MFAIHRGRNDIFGFVGSDYFIKGLSFGSKDYTKELKTVECTSCTNTCSNHGTIMKSCYFEMKVRPRGYKTFFMLNSVEHEIFLTHKC